MKNPLFLFILITLSFICSSCDSWEGVPSQDEIEEGEPLVDNGEPPEGEHPKDPSKDEGESLPEDENKEHFKESPDFPDFEFDENILLEYFFLDKKTLVGDIRENDWIVVRLRGLERRILFSETYEENFTSSWIEESYDLYDPDDSKKGFPSEQLYFNDFAESYGKCRMSYRDKLGESKKTIEFSKKAVEVPLRLIIGSQSYPLDKITTHKGDVIIGTLEVKPEMVRHHDKLYISPLNESLDTVKIGFIDYVDCPNKWRKSFSPGGSTQSEVVNNQLRREFYLDLKVVRFGEANEVNRSEDEK